MAYDLSRFHHAQKNSYETALSEIRAGRKRSHWIWYIFPQIQGLGFSSTAQYYAIEDLKEALKIRMAYFHDHNCRLSDHALNYVMYAPADEAKVEKIFADRLAGVIPGAEEEVTFKFAFMAAMAEEYARRDWVMQLHYGCRRDNNPVMFKKMGPDTGFDCVDNTAPSTQTAAALFFIRAMLASINSAVEPMSVSTRPPWFEISATSGFSSSISSKLSCVNTPFTTRGSFVARRNSFNWAAVFFSK